MAVAIEAELQACTPYTVRWADVEFKDKETLSCCATHLVGRTMR